MSAFGLAFLLLKVAITKWPEDRYAGKYLEGWILKHQRTDQLIN